MAKNRKSRFDKFYTSNLIVDECLSYIDIDKFKTVVEPSAGKGSFSNRIEGCISYDICPEHDSITNQDYLLLDDSVISSFQHPILVIGNPPFGNQSSLAMAFIKKSVYADAIAFILPKSFKKESLQRRVPDHFHLSKSFDLPDNSFLLEGKVYDVPCVFQIWEKRDYKRVPEVKLPSLTFMFVKKTEHPDISIRRVGVNAGRLFRDADRSTQSHYFIQTDDVDDFIKRWDDIAWKHNNTAGCNSLSKQEIIKEMDY